MEVFVSVGWALEARLWLWVSDLSPLIAPSTKVLLFCACLRRGVHPQSQRCRQCSESHVQKLGFELQGYNNAAVELTMEERSVQRILCTRARFFFLFNHQSIFLDLLFVRNLSEFFLYLSFFFCWNHSKPLMFTHTLSPPFIMHAFSKRDVCLVSPLHHMKPNSDWFFLVKGTFCALKETTKLPLTVFYWLFFPINFP